MNLKESQGSIHQPFGWLVGWMVGLFCFNICHGKFAFEDAKLVDLMQGVLIYVFNTYYQFVFMDQFIMAERF